MQDARRAYGAARPNRRSMMKYKIKLDVAQFRKLVSGESLLLPLGIKSTVEITLDDVASVRLFNLKNETRSELPDHLRETTLRDLVRGSLENALQNGYYEDLRRL